jgi:hypothetical protein
VTEKAGRIHGPSPASTCDRPGYSGDQRAAAPATDLAGDWQTGRLSYNQDHLAHSGVTVLTGGPGGAFAAQLGPAAREVATSASGCAERSPKRPVDMESGVGDLLFADSHTWLCRTWDDLAAGLVWARERAT